jgi:type IV secretion system protein VirB8
MKDSEMALPVQQAELKKYFKDVEAFQIARAKSARRLSKVTVAVAAIALLGNLAQAFTIAIMLPLARIVPVYLWIRPDGTIDSAVSVSSLPATQEQAVVDASLWEYVRLREGFSQDTAQYAYDVVSNYSAPNVRAQYQQYFNYPNPQSPQVTIGRHGTMRVEHISSNNITPSVQQIRYKRTLLIDGQTPISSTWTATIGYSTLRTLPAGLRLTNPGGILVTSYQSSEDSVSSNRAAP